MKEENMLKSFYSKEDKCQLLMECMEWCSHPGNSISQFADDHNIKRTTLYSWKKYFNRSGLSIKDYVLQERSKGLNLPVQRRNTQCSGFVRIMPKKETEIQNQESEEITIQTRYCILKISSSTSRNNLTNILKSVQEAN